MKQFAEAKRCFRQGGAKTEEFKGLGFTKAKKNLHRGEGLHLGEGLRQGVGEHPGGQGPQVLRGEKIPS